MENPFEEQSIRENETKEESFFDGHLSLEERSRFSFFTRKIEEAESSEDKELWAKKLVPYLLKERFGNKLKEEGKEVIEEKEEAGDKEKKGFVGHPQSYEWKKGEKNGDKESLTLQQLIKEKKGIRSEKLVLDREQIEEIKEELLSEIKSWKNA